MRRGGTHAPLVNPGVTRPPRSRAPARGRRARCTPPHAARSRRGLVVRRARHAQRRDVHEGQPLPERGPRPIPRAGGEMIGSQTATSRSGSGGADAQERVRALLAARVRLGGATGDERWLDALLELAHSPRGTRCAGRRSASNRRAPRPGRQQDARHQHQLAVDRRRQQRRAANAHGAATPKARAPHRRVRRLGRRALLLAAAHAAARTHRQDDAGRRSRLAWRLVDRRRDQRDDRTRAPAAHLRLGRDAGVPRVGLHRPPRDRRDRGDRRLQGQKPDDVALQGRPRCAGHAVPRRALAGRPRGQRLSLRAGLKARQEPARA